MKRILGLIAVLTLAGVANADPYTAYLNTYDSLDGITVSGPVEVPPSPYLYDGGAWADVPYGGTGYATIHTMMDPINEINIDPPIDFTYGEFTIELQWYSDWWIPGESITFWLRVYSRAWDEDAGEWVLSGTQNYAYDVEMSGPGGGPGWQTWTRPVGDWNETDYWGPFIDDQVYKFRIDSVLWDPDLTPYSFGISHFELVVPECPHDLDGDDDVDLNDLAMLLSEYGCTPAEASVYDTGGFEAYQLGDLHNQDGWWADPNGVPFDGVAQVIDDPTGGGMGKVVILDAKDSTPDDYVFAERQLDSPITDGVTVFEWDQYRTDTGDNIYHGNCGGWFAAEWDSASPPGQLPPSGWAGGPAPSTNQWHHVRYELNLETGVARIMLDGGAPFEGTFDNTGPTACINWGISNTTVAGNGPLYLDNIAIKRMSICHIDYNADGYTNLTDLATLLAEYGCGAP
jgi:hypothetical protein